MVDYALAEPFNQQLPLDENEQRSPCARIEAFVNGKRVGQHYDFGAVLTAREADDRVTVRADAHLCDAAHDPTDAACSLTYTLTAQGLRIEGTVCGAENARYILPVLSRQVEVTVLQAFAQRLNKQVGPARVSGRCAGADLLPVARLRGT